MTNTTEKFRPDVGQIWSYMHSDITYKFQIVSRHDSMGWNVIYLDSNSPYGENGWYTHRSFNDAKAKYIGWAPGYGPQPPAENTYNITGPTAGEHCASFDELRKLKEKHNKLVDDLKQLIAKYT